MGIGKENGMHESEKKCIGIDVGEPPLRLVYLRQMVPCCLSGEVPTRKEEGGRYILEDVAASIREVLMEKEIHLSDILGAGLGIRDRSCRMAMWRSA